MNNNLINNLTELSNKSQQLISAIADVIDDADTSECKDNIFLTKLHESYAYQLGKHAAYDHITKMLKSEHTTFTKCNTSDKDRSLRREHKKYIEPFVECMRDGQLIELTDGSLYLKLGLGFVDRNGTFKYHLNSVTEYAEIAAIREFRDDTSGHLMNMMTRQNTETVVEFVE